MKIVIWGHPLGTHTHSYSNHGYYRAFKQLGHDVHWFPDEEPPEDFDFSNTPSLLVREIVVQNIFLSTTLAPTS